MNLPLELLLALSLVSQQVTENLLGPFLSGHMMRLASIGVCVGLTFGAKELGLQDLQGFTPLQSTILGVMAGLGSNQLHALLQHFAPGNGAAPIAGILQRLAGRAVPPQPGSQPPPPPPPPPPQLRNL